MAQTGARVPCPFGFSKSLCKVLDDPFAEIRQRSTVPPVEIGVVQNVGQHLNTNVRRIYDVRMGFQTSNSFADDVYHFVSGVLRFDFVLLCGLLVHLIRRVNETLDAYPFLQTFEINRINAL